MYSTAVFTVVQTFLEIAETLHLTRERTLDIAASHLFNANKLSEQWAVKYFLKDIREGAMRGYNFCIEGADASDRPTKIVI